MMVRSRLDGAVPLDAGSGHEVELAALTRRVAELERRLNVMKVIVGLVLAAKVLLVAFVLYIFFGTALAIRGGGPYRSIGQHVDIARPAEAPPPA